jgi:hypothetical protein
VAVAAIPEVGEPQITRTSQDGQFNFSGLATGPCAFVVLPRTGLAPEMHIENLPSNDLPLKLIHPDGGTIDSRLGWIYLGCVIGALLLLTSFYLRLHALYPPSATPVSAPLSALLSQAVDAASGQAATDPLSVTLGLVTRTNEEVLANQLRALPEIEKQQLRDLAAQAQTTGAQGNSAETLSALRALQRRYDQLATAGYFWNQEPWRFIEVLLWGLAGVLIRQILDAAKYVRRDRFYREGLALHLAQVFTSPIITLVSVFILSLIKLEVTIAGSAVELDLSNPAILVALSFLIGINFWNVWDALKNVIQSLFNRSGGAAQQPAA